MKSVIHKDSGRELKFGCNKPVGRQQGLRLRSLLPKVKLKVPAGVDYAAAATRSLHDILLNDEFGCCVISAGYHILGTLTGNAGELFVPTREQVIHDYSAIGGYVPGDPNTDNGCYMAQAIQYWSSPPPKGFVNGSDLVGWIAVNANDKVECKSAVYLFENLFMATGLPDYWVGRGMPRGDGFTWGTAGPFDWNNGHAIMAMGYNAQGVKVDTWGMLGTVTWPALAKYFSQNNYGELYALLSKDIINKAKAKAPNGLDWDQLTAWLKAFGGHFD